jgi:transcription termination factor Rho
MSVEEVTDIQLAVCVEVITSLHVKPRAWVLYRSWQKLVECDSCSDQNSITRLARDLNTEQPASGKEVLSGSVDSNAKAKGVALWSCP